MLHYTPVHAGYNNIVIHMLLKHSHDGRTGNIGMDTVFQVIEIGRLADVEAETRPVEIVDVCNTGNQSLSADRCRIYGQITAFRMPCKYNRVFRFSGIQILKSKILGRNLVAESPQK